MISQIYQFILHNMYKNVYIIYKTQTHCLFIIVTTILRVRARITISKIFDIQMRTLPPLQCVTCMSQRFLNWVSL